MRRGGPQAIPRLTAASARGLFDVVLFDRPRDRTRDDARHDRGPPRHHSTEFERFSLRPVERCG